MQFSGYFKTNLADCFLLNKLTEVSYVFGCATYLLLQE